MPSIIDKTLRKLRLKRRDPEKEMEKLTAAYTDPTNQQIVEDRNNLIAHDYAELTSQFSNMDNTDSEIHSLAYRAAELRHRIQASFLLQTHEFFDLDIANSESQNQEQQVRPVAPNTGAGPSHYSRFTFHRNDNRPMLGSGAPIHYSVPSPSSQEGNPNPFLSPGAGYSHSGQFLYELPPIASSPSQAPAQRAPYPLPVASGTHTQPARQPGFLSPRQQSDYQPSFSTPHLPQYSRTRPMVPTAAQLQSNPSMHIIREDDHAVHRRLRQEELARRPFTATDAGVPRSSIPQRNRRQSDELMGGFQFGNPFPEPKNRKPRPEPEGPKEASAGAPSGVKHVHQPPVQSTILQHQRIFSETGSQYTFGGRRREPYSGSRHSLSQSDQSLHERNSRSAPSSESFHDQNFNPQRSSQIADLTYESHYDTDPSEEPSEDEEYEGKGKGKAKVRGKGKAETRSTRSDKGKGKGKGKERQ
ncbi:hypothetical protein MIND_00424000 [Mycena indigotica]|uniref:Uncharacterized protein n=1 Tax=Mycena indigotica TaxID=2126181 RepID=A0A8H6SUV9_9AGAR|nr:uncharacterized protein MIND_00424000 [Mycena indigotica]KAF7306328.1 hypothetical protein MIND_00424000 [Mycena indigotica]